MAKTTKLYTNREQALELMNDTSTTEAQLTQLYMCELDINQHSRRKDFTPSLTAEEVEGLYQYLANNGSGKVVRLLQYRRNVMSAAEELEQMKWRVIGIWNSVFIELQQLEAIETMETAVNMALLAIPEPDRNAKAQQIANHIALAGCTQYVDDGGLIRITQEDITATGNYTSNKIEDIRNKIVSMFAEYKGCYTATMDYVRKKKLTSLLPVSLKMLEEYKNDIANYADACGWDKYKDMPINLRKLEYDRKPTIQGLYNIIPSYSTIKPNQKGYQYMCDTYFTD